MRRKLILRGLFFTFLFPLFFLNRASAAAFNWITPVEVTPGTADAWTDVDVSAYLPAGSTGAIIHAVVTKATTGSVAVGLRKNGSTDNRTSGFYAIAELNTHTWGVTGVDANLVFEAYVDDTTDVDIWLVGYTDSNVTFLTNGVDKSLSVTDSWTDIDCSANAPGAIGLIFEVVTGSSTPNVSLRPNGSADNRLTGGIAYHNWVILGCDANQVIEGNIGNLNADFYLIGYVTAGATFFTNAKYYDVDTMSAWTDIDISNNAPGANGAFFEIVANQVNKAAYYGLRKNGSSENITGYDIYRAEGFVEVDTSQVLEGSIADLRTDFWLRGYSIGSPGIKFEKLKIEGIQINN